MIRFKKVEISDREWINERLRESQFKACDYSFVNNYIWRHPNNIEFADINGFYCLKSGEADNRHYTYPAGKGDVVPVIRALMEDAKEHGQPFRLRAIPKDQLDMLEKEFKGVFDITLPREECDYIYTVEKLTSLSGKKLHGKRNHIARFKDNINWSYEPITPENIEECIAMNKEWGALYDRDDEEGVKKEAIAVKSAFHHFFEFGLSGGLLRLDGKVIAFTIGEPLTEDTFVVHIEKAFPDIQGAYPMINQQFVMHTLSGYTYVNREEDMGEEGLRKAKLSYYPDILLEKYFAIAKMEG